MFVRGNIRESKPNLEYKAICPLKVTVGWDPIDE